MWHADLGRDDVKLLERFLAHHFQTRAIVRVNLIGIGQVTHDVFSRQIGWE